MADDPWGVASAAAPETPSAVRADPWGVAGRGAASGGETPKTETPEPSFMDRAASVGREVKDFAGRAADWRDTRMAQAAGGVLGLPRAAADLTKAGMEYAGMKPI